MSRILHLIPTLAGGGAERQLMLLAIAQAKQNNDVHVAVRRGGEYEQKMQESGVKIHFLGDWRGLNPIFLWNLLNLQIRLKPDIVQTWLVQMDILGACSALLMRTPWILSERSSHQAYALIPVVTKIRATLARYAKAIVANSEDGMHFWRTKLPTFSRIFVVANGIAIDQIRSAPAWSPLTKTRSPFLLVVGSLIPSKGQIVFIEALKIVVRSKNVSALIIGSGPDESMLRNAIASHQLENNVQILSYQTNWWGLLKTSDGLVSPSEFEGQPNVVLEAMAMECPLIVSDIRAHRHILTDNSALIVPPRDPHKLADAILALLDKRDSAKRRAASAFQCVRQYTVESASAAYDKIYKTAIDNQGR